MKKILALTFMVLFVATNCFAKTFSQPEKIGRIGNFDQCPYRGFIIDGASFNDGIKYIPSSDYKYKDVISYIKGNARFGNDDDALYCQYNFDFASRSSKKFGGKNQYVYNDGFFYKDIFKIKSDNGLTLYYLLYSYKYTHFAVIGRFSNGKWVKFFDENYLNKNYFSNNNFPHYNDLKCNGDTLIISYRQGYPSKNKENIGEFRFKWDDAAQWFGVEHIVY